MTRFHVEFDLDDTEEIYNSPLDLVEVETLVAEELNVDIINFKATKLN